MRKELKRACEKTEEIKKLLGHASSPDSVPALVKSKITDILSKLEEVNEELEEVRAIRL